ncbi:hypothetical protein QE152_g29942 [Popillia japonica]|uniref:Uncharacterized protein n=1 Tax=Popillia japonica TaxID=7064 RepID=A0AAW1JGF6_POPJA
MSSNSESENEEICGKKRTRNVKLWKINKRKCARQCGESYVSTSGNIVPEKKTGPPCTCKLKCMSKFTDEEKHHILSKLYDGKPKNEQDTRARFLQGLIESKPVERHRKRVADENKTKPKVASFKYHIINNHERIPVCKQAFLNMYSISNFRVQRLNLLLVNGESPKDMRGKHNNRPTSITEDLRVKIKRHIESFPYKTSHYATKNIHYLDSKLNVKTMFELFIKKYPELDKIIKYEFYLKYFNENYSLRFGRPQDSRKKVPFTIKTVSFKDILDFKNWWPSCYKKTCRAVNNGHQDNFAVSKYMQFVYDASLPGYVKCFDYIDGLSSYIFKLIKPNHSPELPTNKAYSEPLTKIK